MRKPVEPIPVELGARFRTATALEHGVPARRLRRRDLDSPFHGVHRNLALLNAPELRQSAPLGIVSQAHTSRDHAQEAVRVEHIERARSYLLIAATDAFFCGKTAAAILGLPVPLTCGDVLHVGRPAPARAPRVAGVRGTQVRQGRAAIGVFRGFPVTSPASTWAMLGESLDVEELVVLGDAMASEVCARSRQGPPREPLATLAELREAMSGRGRPGAPKLRQALALVRTGSSSPPETQLRLALLRAGLPEPELDVEVRDPSGRILGRSELAYVRKRVAFEYESDHHRVEQRQWNRDIGKYQDYAEAGWKVVRVTAHLLYRERQELVRQARVALARPAV